MCAPLPQEVLKTVCVIGVVLLFPEALRDGGPKPRGSVPHGEYSLNRRGQVTPTAWSVPGPETSVVRALSFMGRDSRHVRKLALGWWYQHREKHGLVVKDFLARCRMSPDGRTISFYAR